MYWLMNKRSVPLRVGRDISVQDRIMPVTNPVFVGGGWGWIDAIMRCDLTLEM